MPSMACYRYPAYLWTFSNSLASTYNVLELINCFGAFRMQAVPVQSINFRRLTKDQCKALESTVALSWLRWFHSSWMLCFSVTCEIATRIHLFTRNNGPFHSQLCNYSFQIYLTLYWSRIKKSPYCRLPFNANSSMILYGAIYAISMLSGFFNASANVTADSFLMAIGLHINVMQKHLHTLIGNVNVLFRRYKRNDKCISTYSVLMFSFLP